MLTWIGCLAAAVTGDRIGTHTPQTFRVGDSGLELECLTCGRVTATLEPEARAVHALNSRRRFPDDAKQAAETRRRIGLGRWEE